MTVEDFIFPPLKCVIIGFLVALACCATALGRGSGQDDLRRIVPLGFVRSALAILLVNTIIDVVS
jgi:phospholipid/cholesterol/gamma-HCH transport system permease protein